MPIVLKQKTSDKAVTLIPDGTYRAVLSKTNQFSNAYGDRIGFEFTLKDPPVDGQTVMRSTSPVLSPSGKLADILRGMLGRELTIEELKNGLDIEKLVGTECNLLILQAKSKGGMTYSNIERIFPTNK